jgi:hypothetical protein
MDKEIQKSKAIYQINLCRLTIENAINATPTGEIRTFLTEINIFLMTASDEVKNYDNPSLMHIIHGFRNGEEIIKDI